MRARPAPPPATTPNAATCSPARRPWLHTTWHWRTLLVATLAFVLLVALPWRAATWQPDGLPSTWIEPTLAAIRLAIVAALIALGFAIMVVTAARQTVQVATHVKE